MKLNTDDYDIAPKRPGGIELRYFTSELTCGFT